MGVMTERLREVIGFSICDLDGRFEAVRTTETNLGNFVCDVIRVATEADVVIVNGGETVRVCVVLGMWCLITPK